MFEDLLPEYYNSRILKLLFHFAHWHGLAKLRMHSNRTLDILDHKTTVLGEHLRDFEKKVCSAFQTKELPREVAARRRRAKKGATGNSASKLRFFNLETYKFHALGDYVETIRRYGATDSYSTEPVSI